MNLGKILLFLAFSNWYLRETASLVGTDHSRWDTPIPITSLKDVDECNIPEMEIKTTYAELLQLAHLKTVHMYQCRVDVLRQVFYCSPNGYLEAVPNGNAKYLVDISPDECETIQKKGQFQYGDSLIDGLRQNATEIRVITIAGEFIEDGHCTGVPYTDHFGYYGEQTVVQGTLHITLIDYVAEINLDNNKIHLRGGYSCNYHTTYYPDTESEISYWQEVPSESCIYDNYSVLFLIPRNLILKENRTQISCNPFPTVGYNINNRWYKFLPVYTEVKTQPNDQPTCNPRFTISTSEIGNHRPIKFNQLKPKLAFPSEREAILSEIAKKVLASGTNL